jgi:ribonucleotide reductase beta subunit family protein with ferritin-like domain
MPEPVLAPSASRLTILPVQHVDLWGMYKKALASFWTAEEVQAALGSGKDRVDFERMRPEEREFLERVLAFFAAADGIVIENAARRFLDEVQWAEARAFYACQLMMETIHSETYSLLIAALVPSEKRQRELLESVESMPTVKAKAQWALKWVESRRSFAHRLVAFACLEGVAFSAAFASIFWLRHRGMGFPALCLANEFIARDEGMHTDFACLLYGHLEHKLSDKEAHTIVQGCVDVEKQFIAEALPARMVGMNADQLLEYVQFCADRLLGSLGHKALYGARNPFQWMEQISIGVGKTNFFEREVSEYRLPGVGISAAEQEVSMDADF